MKVYYPKSTSPSLARVHDCFVKYAPPDVVFVNDFRDADVHFLDFVGQHPYYYKNVPDIGVPLFPLAKKVVLLMHTTGHPGFNYNNWFKQFDVIVSYIPPWHCDFVGIFDWDAFSDRYILTPWGVDEVFSRRNVEKKYDVITSGTICEDELIDVVDSVCAELGLKCAHTGIKAECELRATEELGILDDDKLAETMSASEYASGLRRYCGFELFALEATFAGAQPIYLNLPVYRYWFSDGGIFVDLENVKNDLINILSKREKKDTSPMLKYSCKNVFPKLWERILEFFHS